jgi:catechol 2,3-dioxygenase-like lactoylglutathione lyase family enzyme
MLENYDSSAIVAVSDMRRARQFYGETLGLEVLSEMGSDVVTYRTGKTRLAVYCSPENAGTNSANAVVWGVGKDLVAIVDALRSKGVQFLRYPELPGVTLDGDLHRAGPNHLVWFADPDGNILHLNDL